MKGIVILAMALMIGSLFATGFALAEEVGSATTARNSEVSPMPVSAGGVGNIPVVADEISSEFELIDTEEIQTSVRNVQEAGSTSIRASGFSNVFTGVGYAVSSSGETKTVEIMIASQEYSASEYDDFANRVVSKKKSETSVSGVNVEPVDAQAISPNGLKFGIAKTSGNSGTSADSKDRLFPVGGIKFVSQGNLVLGEDKYGLNFEKSESENANVYSVVLAGNIIGSLKLDTEEKSGELSFVDESYEIRLENSKTQKVRPVSSSVDGENYGSKVFAKSSAQAGESVIAKIFASKVFPWNWFK